MNRLFVPEEKRMYLCILNRQQVSIVVEKQFTITTQTKINIQAMNLTIGYTLV